MPRFHHTNIGLLPEQREELIEWIVDVLQYKRVPLEPTSPFVWLEADDGTQIHFGFDPDHRPAAKAHNAITFASLDPVRERLERRNQSFDYSDRGAVPVIVCVDPAGNKWELRKEAAN